MLRWLVSLVFGLGAGIALAQAPADDLAQKQLMMLSAEAQYFATLAKVQKDEIDKFKAAPCNEPK